MRCPLFAYYFRPSFTLLLKSVRKKRKFPLLPNCNTVLFQTTHIQGTFHASDNLKTVRSWITECLSDPSTEYQLWAPPGTASGTRSTGRPTARAELVDTVATLAALGLAPCGLLNLAVTRTEASPSQPRHLIRPDLLSASTVL